MEIDESLASGLEREIKQNEKLDDNFKLFFVKASETKYLLLNKHYMPSSKSGSNVSRLARSGDIRLEGIIFFI